MYPADVRVCEKCVKMLSKHGSLKNGSPSIEPPHVTIFPEN